MGTCLISMALTLAGTSAGHAMKGKVAARCPSRNTPRGAISFSDWQFPDTLNPYQSSLLVSREVTNALFEDLFRYDDHARLVPQLAATIPTVRNGGIKDGGKTIVLHLKRGLRWSNGAEITSRDIWFGWRVGMDRATGPSCLGGCDAIRSIDTPSRYSAVLHLRQPYSAAVPDTMPDVWPHTWTDVWKDNPHLAALKLGQDQAFNFENSSFPTDGAYQVAQFVPHDHITLRPMRYYTGMTCGGYVKDLTFFSYRSKAELIAAAAAGKTDITMGYNRADLPELDKHRNAYRVRLRTSFSFEHLELNLDPRYQQQPNPLSDARVRLALALALDKYTLIQNALDASPSLAPSLAAWTPFVEAPDLRQPLVSSTPTGQWDPIARQFVIPGTHQALVDARRLLNQTAYKGGFTLDFYTTSGSPGRQVQEAAIASSWSKLGVKVKPNYVSASKLLAGWDQGGIAVHGDFQVAMFAYLGSPDPDQYKFNLQSRYCDRTARIHSTINGNNSCVHDPLIDGSLSAAARSFSVAARAADYAAIARQINIRAYWIPLYFRSSIATDDGRVANFSNNPTQLGPTWNIYAWKVK